MKYSYLVFSVRSFSRLLPHLLGVAVSMSVIGASLPKADKEEVDLSESPAQMWVENLPASKQLSPAPRPQSVPAFGRDASAPNVAASFWKSIGPTALNGQTSNRVDPVSGRDLMGYPPNQPGHCLPRHSARRRLSFD